MGSFHYQSLFGAAAFVDVGGTSDGALGDIFYNNLYANVGVGLRLAFPRSSGGKMLLLDVAFPMRDGPDGSAGLEVRVIFVVDLFSIQSFVVR